MLLLANWFVNVRKKLVKWRTAVWGAATWTVRTVDQKYNNINNQLDATITVY